MTKLTIILFTFFALTSCVSVQIPKSMQEQISRIEKGIESISKKTDTNTVNIQKNYQSFLKILQNATNPNNTYKPITDDELIKLLNGPTTNGKGTKN